MALPTATQLYEHGKRVVTTPALVNSTNWKPGDVWLDGSLAVHYADGLRELGAGVQCSVNYLGAFTFACATGVTAAKDSDAYYDTVNKTIVTAAGTNIILVGKFVVAKTSGQLTAVVQLNAALQNKDGEMFSARIRSTIAEVNAGKTLLPALPGFRYRVSNIRMISIGGAAAAVTTVDVLGTQGASSVKLFAGAQASLLQSAVLTAGGSGGAVLADGASFVSNDVNTAITINKTGSAVTTATNIDVLIDYSIEAA
jgi:hypothetical protein